MFYKKDSGKYIKAFDGVTYKTLTYGDKTSLGEFKLEKGCIIPNHNHLIANSPAIQESPAWPPAE